MASLHLNGRAVVFIDGVPFFDFFISRLSVRRFLIILISSWLVALGFNAHANLKDCRLKFEGLAGQKLIYGGEIPRRVSAKAELIHTYVDAQGRHSYNVNQFTDRVLLTLQYEYDNYFVEIMRPTYGEVVAEISKPAAHQLSEVQWKEWRERRATQGIKQYTAKVFEALDFVFADYLHRKHWSPTFLRKLTDVALQYLMTSTYINVRVRDQAGQPGQIVGTMRLISAPFKITDRDNSGVDANHDEDLRRELNNISGVGAPYRADNLVVHSNNAFWLDIFKGGVLSPSFDSAPIFVEGNINYLKTPTEAVLGPAAKLSRQDLTAFKNMLESVIEPGNFAVSRAFNRFALPALMFHAARLSQGITPAVTLGKVQQIITYAEPGSSSWMHYTDLGLKADSTGIIDEDGTVWNVLKGTRAGLVDAYRKRFQALGLSEEDVHDLFFHFDITDQQLEHVTVAR